MDKYKPLMTDNFGKLPPQALELEEDILGACMIDSGAFNLISDYLKAEMFYKLEHQKIYSAMEKLDLNSQPIDIHTVTQQLTKDGTLEEVGGAYAIVLLTSRAAASAHIEFHAQIILQKFLSREMISLSSEIQTKAFDEKEDVDDVMNYFEKRFTDLSTGIIPSEEADMVTCALKTKELLQTIQTEKDNGTMFVKTPLAVLNKSLKGGFKGGQLVIVAGRPGAGKTQIGLNIAEKASETLYGLFFSLEMMKEEITQRLILQDERISDYRMETGNMSNDEWIYVNEKLNEISELKLSIIDNESQFAKIRSTIRRKVREKKCDYAVIDYLQLIQTGISFQTRDLEIGFMTRNLKSLAKELNIPIILLSQLNRPEKGLKIRRPQLTDLRESGNIEQDADIVIFVHRPSYYDPQAIDDYGNSYQSRGILVKAKHRNGSVEDIEFEHDERFKRIWDYDRTYTETPKPVPAWEENKPF